MSWCITAKGLFPTTEYLPGNITYDNLKSKLDDPIAGVKKGSWILFCPDVDAITKTVTDAKDMKKCRESVKFLYSCKTKGFK